MNDKGTSIILAVDLDNTLIRTDMIYVGLKFLLLYKIYLLPKLLWLLVNKGKTYAKHYLYSNTKFSIENIKLNQAVVSFIKSNKKKYTSIILISGSYFKYVEVFAKHLNLFDYSVGTTLDTNMVSFNKVKYLKNKYKNFKFDYIGDSKKDIPIWEYARNAYVVDNGNITKYLKHIDYKVIG